MVSFYLAGRHFSEFFSSFVTTGLVMKCCAHHRGSSSNPVFMSVEISHGAGSWSKYPFITNAM